MGATVYYLYYFTVWNNTVVVTAVISPNNTVVPLTVISVNKTLVSTSVTFGNNTVVPRGELRYLAPLGSENISAPYFKQCFFQGGYYLPD